MGRWSREYGPVLVFWRLWEKLGLQELFDELYRSSEVEFPVEEAVFGMVLNRLLEPDSKLGAYEWLKERQPTTLPLGTWNCSICAGPWTSWTSTKRQWNWPCS